MLGLVKNSTQPTITTSSDLCRLVCVDPARVHEIWPHVEAMIARAMVRGVSDFDELEQRVWRGQALLWIVWDGERILAAVVTAIQHRRRPQAMHHRRMRWAA